MAKIDLPVVMPDLPVREAVEVLISSHRSAVFVQGVNQTKSLVLPHELTAAIRVDSRQPMRICVDNVVVGRRWESPDTIQYFRQRLHDQFVELPKLTQPALRQLSAESFYDVLDVGPKRALVEISHEWIAKVLLMSAIICQCDQNPGHVWPDRGDGTPCDYCDGTLHCRGV